MYYSVSVAVVLDVPSRVIICNELMSVHSLISTPCPREFLGTWLADAKVSGPRHWGMISIRTPPPSSLGSLTEPAVSRSQVPNTTTRCRGGRLPNKYHGSFQDNQGYLHAAHTDDVCFRVGSVARYLWCRPKTQALGKGHTPSVLLRNRPHPPTATVPMEIIDRALCSVAGNLSDENYSESLTFYKSWFDIAQTHHQIPSDQIFDAIWKNRGTSSIDPGGGNLIHSTAHLVLRFARDVESDRVLAPHNSSLQSRLCARSLQAFLSKNLTVVRDKEENHGGGADRDFYADTNLVAHWANIGYVEEAAIRHHILQSLISHPQLYDHQADAVTILLKLAGATFEAYADPSVVDRCFELLKDHYSHETAATKKKKKKVNPATRRYLAKRELVQVRAPRDERWSPG